MISSVRHWLRSAPPLGAGILDAGVAALAAFLVSVYAVRVLTPDQLGAHALAFVAMILFATLPERLVFLPTLAVSVERRAPERLGYYREGLRVASPLVPAGLAIALVFLLLPAILSDAERIALTGAAVSAALFQSVQLFGRQILHYSNRSGGAIFTSLIRLAATAIALAALSESGLPFVAVPLAALSAGNAAAAVWVAVLRPPQKVARLSIRMIYGRGSYLAASAAAPVFAGFVVAYLVIAIGGAAMLGFAEAARVAAQPVFVGAAGLGLAVSPRLMAGAVARDNVGVAQTRRVFLGLLWAGAVGYAVLLATPGIGLTIQDLLPNVFVVGGLVAASILAQAALGTMIPYAAEAIALGREQAVLVAELSGAVVIIAFGLTVPLIGAFAIPVGLSGAGFIRTAILAFMLRDRQLSPEPPRHFEPLPGGAIHAAQSIE